MLILESSKEWVHRTHLVGEQFPRPEGGSTNSVQTQVSRTKRKRSGSTTPFHFTVEGTGMCCWYPVLTQTFVFMNLLLPMQQEYSSHRPEYMENDKQLSQTIACFPGVEKWHLLQEGQSHVVTVNRSNKA